MAGNKTTGHVRIYSEDIQKLKDWSKALGESTPRLLSKIIKSDKLKLDKRMIEEFIRKQEENKRRLGL